MAHWGWYWKIKLHHKSKLLCSQVTRLDSFQLLKGENLAIPVNLRSYFYTCSVTFEDGAHSISLEAQRCNYGGYRYFFHCPRCNKRMRMLYCAKSQILCRKCLNLGYLTQKLTPSGRARHMVFRLEARLETGGGGLYTKPKGMHQETFRALKRRYYKYDRQFGEALTAELVSYYPNKASEIIELGW